jgi:predicted Zn-dependent protease
VPAKPSNKFKQENKIINQRQSWPLRYGCRTTPHIKMKKLHRLFLLISVVACLGFGSGCETLKKEYSLENRGSSLVDERKLSELGKQTFEKLKAKNNPLRYPIYNAALQRVGSSLTHNLSLPHTDWEFVIFDSNTPNAFALPGGKIGICSALFKYIDNDAELAMVVGHEVGHILCSHSSEQQGQEIFTNVVGTALELTMEDKRIHKSYKLLSNVGMTLPYSRAHEYEADYFGLKLLSESGYSPRLALKFWDKLAQIHDKSDIEFFSTHPNPYSRKRALTNRLDEFLLLYNHATIKRGPTYGIVNNKLKFPKPNSSRSSLARAMVEYYSK